MRKLIHHGQDQCCHCLLPSCCCKINGRFFLICILINTNNLFFILSNIYFVLNVIIYVFFSIFCKSKDSIYIKRIQFIFFLTWCFTFFHQALLVFKQLSFFFSQIHILKDIHREKAPSNKTPALRKSTNMGVWAVGTLNQLFIRGS